ncbi:MAG: HIT family protein [Desulfuromonas sp.]|nr:MAG: HIT family protein [Desulfuromonas sp.]
MNDCRMCHKWHDEAELRIAEFEHSYVMLNRDQFFPGYSFVFTREHITELFHLDPSRRHAIIDEVNRVAEVLAEIFQPAKMNYELLGNMVPHMHWHLVPRFETDPLWPQPIWAEPHDEVLLSPAEYKKRIEKIKEKLKEI